jgi:hypothetical protein
VTQISPWVRGHGPQGTPHDRYGALGEAGASDDRRVPPSEIAAPPKRVPQAARGVTRHGHLGVATPEAPVGEWPLSFQGTLYGWWPWRRPSGGRAGLPGSRTWGNTGGRGPARPCTSSTVHGGGPSRPLDSGKGAAPDGPACAKAAKRPSNCPKIVACGGLAGRWFQGGSLGGGTPRRARPVPYGGPRPRTAPGGIQHVLNAALRGLRGVRRL